MNEILEQFRVKLKLTKEEFGQLILAINNTGASFSGLGDKVYKTKQSMAAVLQTLHANRELLSKNQITLAKYNQEVRTAKDSINAFKADLTANIKIQKDLEVQMEKINAECGLASNKFKAMGQAMGTVKNVVTQMATAGMRYASVLGVQAVSFDNIVKSLTTYNQGLFTASRSQQLLGRGTDSITSAFERVRKNTILSTNEFLAFTNTITKGYTGITPTGEAMAELAEIMQKSFGPNLDIIIQKSNDWLSVQSKFPELANQVIEAQKAMSAGETERADALRASMLATGVAIGLTTDQLSTMMQITTRTTGEQDKMVKVNEDIAKNSQKSQDAILALGKAMESSIDKAAKIAGQALDIFQKWAPAIAGIGVAFAGINFMVPLLQLKKMGELMMALKMSSKAVPEVASVLNLGKGTGLVTKLTRAGTMVGAGTAGLGLLGAAAGGVAVGMAADYATQKLTPTHRSISDRLAETFGPEQMTEERAKSGTSSVRRKEAGTFLDIGFLGKDYEDAVAKVMENTKERMQKGGEDYKDIAKEQQESLKQLYNKYAKERIETEERTKQEVGENEEKGPGYRAKRHQEEIQLKKEVERLQKEYNGLKEQALRKGAEEPKLIQDAIRKSDELFQLQTKYNKTIWENVQEWTAVNKNVENYINLLGQVSGNLQKIGQIGEEMGVANKEAFEKASLAARLSMTKNVELAKQLLEMVGQQQEKMGGNFEGLTDALEAIDKTGDPLADAQSSALVIMDMAEKIMEFGKDKAFASALIGQAKELTNVSAKQAELSKSMITDSVKFWATQIDTANKFNTLQTARIQNERTYYSTVMLGMGVDLNMLNKLMGSIKNQIAANVQGIQEMGGRIEEAIRAGERGFMDPQDLQDLQEVVGYEEKISKIEQLIDKYNSNLKNDVTAYDTAIKGVLAHCSEWEKRTSNVVNLSKEMAEITKDIREGYLLAMQEMNTGAKEFGKVIGTKEMNVTQIFRAAQRAGEGYTGTQLIGGIMAGNSPWAWARKTPAARVGIAPGGGPALFAESEEQSMAKLKTLSRYKEAEEQAMAAREGRMPSYRKAGEAVAPKASDYAVVLFESGRKANESIVSELKEIKENLKLVTKPSDVLPPVKHGVRRDVTSPKDAWKPIGDFTAGDTTKVGKLTERAGRAIERSGASMKAKKQEVTEQIEKGLNLPTNEDWEEIERRQKYDNDQLTKHRGWLEDKERKLKQITAQRDKLEEIYQEASAQGSGTAVGARNIRMAQTRLIKARDAQGDLESQVKRERETIENIRNSRRDIEEKYYASKSILGTETKKSLPIETKETKKFTGAGIDWSKQKFTDLKHDKYWGKVLKEIEAEDLAKAPRGITGGILPSTSAVAKYKLADLEAMAERGRKRVSSGLKTGARHIRGLGESSSHVRKIGAGSTHVRELGSEAVSTSNYRALRPGDLLEGVDGRGGAQKVQVEISLVGEAGRQFAALSRVEQIHRARANK